uniref:Uncharacterized protein n=1 Tax=Eutreptiella gymnastica TaxID=73025 RepID=A0A7S1IJY5_9EUGL
MMMVLHCPCLWTGASNDQGLVRPRCFCVQRPGNGRTTEPPVVAQGGEGGPASVYASFVAMLKRTSIGLATLNSFMKHTAEIFFYPQQNRNEGPGSPWMLTLREQHCQKWSFCLVFCKGSLVVLGGCMGY